LHQVTPDLFRSSQPDKKDLADLQALGIRSILNLREHHHDRSVKGFDRLQLATVEMDAGEVTPQQVFQALRILRDAPKPALIHCWHGSDRTGVVVAAYRMVFQNWTAEAAIDEMKAGDFGYHARTYPNLLKLLRSLDAAQWRKDLGQPQP
jgi:protein tyrosine/serine phosphatase